MIHFKHQADHITPELEAVWCHFLIGISKDVPKASSTSHSQCSALDCAVLRLLTPVWLFVTPWTIAYQAPLSMGILQAWILEWVAVPSSRGSSQASDQTQVSSTAGIFFTIWATGKPMTLTTSIQISCCRLQASQATVLLVQECRLAVKAGQYGYAAPWLINYTVLTGASRSSYLLVSPRGFLSKKSWMDVYLQKWRIYIYIQGLSYCVTNLVCPRFSSFHYCVTTI